MRTFVIAAVAVLTAIAFMPVHAWAADKEKVMELGKRKVDFKTDHDTIEVGKHDGKFTSLRFKVADGDLVMEKMKVVFENGEVFEPETKLEFHEGSRSRDIDLPGNRRTIKRIEFTYRSEHHKERAEIVVFGIEK